MGRTILIPGEVPEHAQFNKAERKIHTFLKGTIRKKLSREDFIQIGNVLQISLLIIVVVVYLHFKIQNEIKAADQAKVIEKILGNKFLFN